MALLYFTAGIYHFYNPEFYLPIMPPWLPAKMLLIYAGGAAEITLAIMLMFKKTRKTGAKLIIAMLVIYLILNHIPQSIMLYKMDDSDLGFSIFRLGLQFLLIAWAWIYTKNTLPTTSHTNDSIDKTNDKFG